YHWLAAGQNMGMVKELNDVMKQDGAQTLLTRTHRYWQSWVNKAHTDFADLSAHLIEFYKRCLLVVRTQSDRAGAILAANDADVEHFARDSYSYMWPRDGALVADALNQASYGGATRHFYDFCNAVLTPEGYLLQKYHPDHSWGSSWEPWIDTDGKPQLPIQEDSTALVLASLWQHYEHFQDIEFLAPYYHSLVVPAADFLVSYRDASTHLTDPSYDLWEERRGILAFTTAAVYAGLTTASRCARLFGEEERAVTYQHAATEIKEAALQHLWDEEHGHFARMITVDKHGQIHKDPTLDSSLCGLFLFGMVPARDPQMERTMQILEQTLWVRTEVGGMARYENDHYHQVTQDLSQAQGNPWFICTLWLARYRIARATTLDALHQALPLLDWAHRHALPSGIMAEQVNPFTSEPLSVSPLTWSHAEYILTVGSYLSKYEQIQKGQA
ncbi:MAG TPA: glycoside hydrolase family 15 protein, partial [Ktedonobacteraceae bacterium]|nr:glycoside hydrolase family 15 protein [Ktedonobacteraceae bacterium]